MRRKSPQEKKRLSLAKDRRNNYGENNKSARKGIPRRRAKGNRKYRRALKSGLNDPEFGVVVPAKAARIRKTSWKKWPDERLGEVIKKRLSKRKVLANRKSNRSRIP